MSSDNNKGLAQSIQVNGLTWAKTLMICAILVCAGVAAYYGANVSVNVSLADRVSAIEHTLEVPVNSSFYPFQNPSTYIVGIVDAYSTLQNGSTGKLDLYSVNHTLVMETGLDAVSVLGGSVYVKEGSYSASHIVRNNTRFIVEKGAVGIAYTIDSQATCIIDDFNGGIFGYYSNGVPYSLFDYGHSRLLLQSANLTSIYVQNISSLNGNVQIFRFIIENGSSFPSPSSGYLFDMNNTVYYYNSTAWVPWGSGTGGTLDYNQLINKPDLSQYLFENGTRPLTANWNTNSFGIYGLFSLNATSLYCTTIDQLVSGQGVKILNLVVQSGTSFPVSPIDKQEYYRSDQGYLYVYNNSAWSPIGYTPNTFPYANLTGVPVILLANGSQPLTADWNVGGSFGIYNVTWINATSLSLSSQLWYNGNNCTDILANPWLPCSYILHTDGTYTYAKSGLTGQIAWYSRNATYVINSALNASSSGQMILATDGVYSINGTILLQHNYQQLWGQSWNTIFRGDGYMDGAIVAIGAPVSAAGPGLEVNGTMLANIQIDANNTGTTELNCKACYCTPLIPSVYTDYTQYSWFDGFYHVYAHGAKSEGISFDFNVESFCIDCRIEDNGKGSSGWAEFAYYISLYGFIQGNEINGQFEAAGTHRLMNLGSMYGTIVTGNILRNETVAAAITARGAVANEPCHGNTFSSNYFLACYQGIDLQGASADASDNVIQGNIFKDCTYAIYLEKATSANITANSNSVIGNVIDNVARHGITLVGANNTIIEGNIIDGQQVAGYNGIDLEQYGNLGCFNNTIVNNKIGATTTNKFTYAIREQYPGDFNTFRNNQLSGFTTAAFLLNGTHDTVGGNVGYNPVGYITNPGDNLNTTLLDSGTFPIQNNTLYTCAWSDKVIYVSGGTVSLVQVAGQTVFTATNVMVMVPAGVTFKIVWSSAPTIVTIAN